MVEKNGWKQPPDKSMFEPRPKPLSLSLAALRGAVRMELTAHRGADESRRTRVVHFDEDRSQILVAFLVVAQIKVD